MIAPPNSTPFWRLFAPLFGAHKALYLSKTKHVVFVMDNMFDVFFEICKLNCNKGSPSFPLSTVSYIGALTEFCFCNKNMSLTSILVGDATWSLNQENISILEQCVDYIIPFKSSNNIHKFHPSIDFDLFPVWKSAPFFPDALRAIATQMNDLNMRLRTESHRQDLSASLKMHIDFWENEELTSLSRAQNIFAHNLLETHPLADSIIICRSILIFHFIGAAPTQSKVEEYQSLVLTSFKREFKSLYNELEECVRKFESGLMETEMSKVLNRVDSSLMKYRFLTDMTQFI